MSSIDRFRAQHGQLIELSKSLAAYLDPARLRRDAAGAKRAQSRFIGVLKVHAAMESEAFYPVLLAHEDRDIRRTAQRLYDEVEGVYAEVFDFADRWKSAAKIGSDPDGFIRDANSVLRTLGKRLRRENEVLYPLVERIGM